MESLGVCAQPFAIVCDSGCDIPFEFYADHNVSLVPFHVRLGADDLFDLPQAVPEDIYVRFSARKERVLTSQPSPAEYLEVYRSLISQGYKHIISLHISSELSGSYSAAMAAAADLTNEATIEVIDTKRASCAMGFVLADLVAMRDANATFEDACAHARMMCMATRIYFIPTQKNALGTKKSYERGMLTRIHKAMDSMFGTRFLECLDREGRINSAVSARDLSDAAGKLARLMSKDAHIAGDLVYVEISAGTPAALSFLEKPLDTNEFESECIGYASVGPALASHVGVGCVGIAYVASAVLFDRDFILNHVWKKLAS